MSGYSLPLVNYREGVQIGISQKTCLAFDGFTAYGVWAGNHRRNFSCFYSSNTSFAVNPEDIFRIYKLFNKQCLKTMRKIVLFVLLLAVGLASCSKKEAPVPQDLTVTIPDNVPGISVDGLVITQSNPSKDQTFEMTLNGAAGEVAVAADKAAAAWCTPSVIKGEAADGWKISVKVLAHTGNEDRFAYLTVTSGADREVFQLIQSGRAKKVRMIVVNEGQFTKGTAAISAIRYDGSSDFDVFRSVNGRPLGDVAQSITYIDGKYFVVLNNSKKIEVVEPETFKSIQTIHYEQAASPRFMVRLDDHRALVSDLQAQLTIVDTKAYKVLEHVSLGTGRVSIEKMVVAGNKIFCAAGGKTGLAVFDADKTISEANMRSIPGVSGIVKTAKMILDKNNKLWVMGSAMMPSATLLYCVNPVTEQIEQTIRIPYVKKDSPDYEEGCITGGSSYNRMDTDATRGKLYFYMNVLKNKASNTSQGAIMVFDTDQQKVDATPYRMLPDLGMMYGMGISPQGDVFMCDCLDYTAQRGFLREYKASGDVLSLRVGIYPRMVHFTGYDN